MHCGGDDQGSSDTGATMIRDLATAIICDGKSKLTGSKVWLSAFTRARVMLFDRGNY